MASDGGRRRNGRGASAAARAAAAALAEITGRRTETVLGVRREEDGWSVLVEVVELSRVPNSTDVLGSYRVTVDRDGELTGYERVRRYQRGQTGGEEP